MAQVLSCDDAASSLEKAMRKSMKTGADVEAARRVGKELAERAKKAGVDKVVFDRAGYMYHGRVGTRRWRKALARAVWISSGATEAKRRIRARRIPILMDEPNGA